MYLCCTQLYLVYNENMNTTTTAIAYLRVSTDEQAASGAGLDAQRDSCREWCRSHGVELADSFVDEGISGATGLDKRPGLLDALSVLPQGGVLLVSKRDRLGRDPIVVAMIEAAVSRKGATVVSSAGEGTEGDAPTDVLMRRIVDAFSEYERLVIKARTRAALTAKKARSERVGAIPYGYQLASDGVHIEEHSAEQAVLAEARKLREAGLSLRAVASELAKRGFKSRKGGTFAATQIKRMMVA